MPRWDVHFEMTVGTANQKIVEYVAKIHAFAAVIRGIPIPPHVQERLDRLNIVRAVRGTTGIEGAELSEEEVNEIVQTPRSHRVLPQTRAREEQEVRNANDLMLYVAQELKHSPRSPLTENLILKFHEITTQGIDYPHNSPGQYRTFPVHAGTYLPPETEEDVRRLMTEFIAWLNTGPPKNWDLVIRAIAAHFFVISIHPFGDGNGRTARAVESYLLYQAGVNVRGYYSLANYYYLKRAEYVDMLDHVRFRSDPDLTPFVAFALQGLVEELEAVHIEVLSEVRIISFRDFARETLLMHGKLGTPVGERLLLFLFGLGIEPVPIKELRGGKHELSSLYKDVTSKTLMRDINFLKQHELILVEGDQLRANLAVMTQFTATNSPRYPSVTPQQPA
jgi:Fic family protein